MKVSVEVSHNLRILGLSPGATPSEVRSAFRRLARTCHPDIAGRQNARRFEQITCAYTFLKNLPRDELLQPEAPGPAAPGAGRRRGRKWNDFLAWIGKRREPQEAKRERRDGAAEAENAENAAKRRQKTRAGRVDRILARAEGTADSLLKRLEREARACDAEHLILRLQSDRLQVRHLALSRLRLGPAADRSEILDAVIDALRKRDIDEKTARLVSALPLSPESRRKLADSLAGKASHMPDFLMAYLLNLHDAQKTDRPLVERYLQNASPGGAGFLLRHWTRVPFAVSAPVVQNLLSHEDEGVLVPLLSMMKRNSVPCPPRSLDRLKTLSAHPSAAVRVWAKALLGK